MFDNKNKPLDLIKHVQEARKTLPYTVSDIGGVEELKAWQKFIIEKEEAWQRKKAQKNQQVVHKLQHTIDTNSIYEDVVTDPTDITKLFERHNKAPQFKTLIVTKEKPKVSIFTRVITYLVDLFLNIKYNRG